MATHKTPNPNQNRKLSRLPQDIIDTIFAKFSVKDILQLRSVCKSWLSLISSPCFVKTHEMIMYNIFLRLPVKTLLTLKSVCKSWLCIISSCDFVKTHLYISTHDPHLTHHGLIITQNCAEQQADPPWLTVWNCSVHFLLNKSYIYTKTVGYKYLRPDSIVGCCNGLVLVRNYSDYRCSRLDLFLWNPSTRKSRILPDLDVYKLYSPTDYEFISLGWYGDLKVLDFVFCYDKWNDDFKVFAISGAHSKVFPLPPGQGYIEKVSVYSLKSDCWRTIGDFPFGRGYDHGEFAVGAIHWVSREEWMGIVSLDLKTETFRKVLLPDFEVDETWDRKFGTFGESEEDETCDWKLGTFGESLSVFCDYENSRRRRFDLWVTKDPYVEGSWTKLFTIPYMDGLEEISELKPLCMFENGDIMLRFDITVLLYDSKNHTFKDLINYKCIKDSDVYTYVESLVSPHL